MSPIHSVNLLQEEQGNGSECLDVRNFYDTQFILSNILAFPVYFAAMCRGQFSFHTQCLMWFTWGWYETKSLCFGCKQNTCRLKTGECGCSRSQKVSDPGNLDINLSLFRDRFLDNMY